MSDPREFDPIAASLRRQFAPPSLEALAQSIEEEAARLEHTDEAAPANEPPADTRVVEAVPPSREPGGLVLGFAVAFAVAAAIVVLLARPWDPDPVAAPTPPVAEAPASMPPTTSQRAGEQLDRFLALGAHLGGDEESCAPPEPSEVCDGGQDYPHLLPNASVRQVGECGGGSGRLCADFDLPADRALLVQLSPEGEHAIVCIERAWTDPAPELPASSAYNIFRSQLGDYVIYEVTPLAQPRARDFLRL